MNAQPQDIFEIQNGPRVTPSSAQSSANSRNKKHFYDPAELFAEIEEKFLINMFFKKRFDAMWNALGNAYGGVFWVGKDASAPPSYKYGVPQLFAAVCCAMDIVNIENKGIHFRSANGAIKVRKGSLQFVPGVDEAQLDPNSKDTPPVKKMSLEDAFNVLILASFNEFPPHKLELVGGNDEDRAIYYQAIKAFNKSVSANMRFRLDPELAKHVENAPSADAEMIVFMDRVRPDTSRPAAKRNNVHTGPTITPDIEPEEKPQDTAEKEPEQGPTASPEVGAEEKPQEDTPEKETKNPTEPRDESKPETDRAAQSHVTPAYNITYGTATMNGKALQAKDYQNLVNSCTFDPQLTLAKTFIGSRVYRLHPDEYLPAKLLNIYESAAGGRGHGATIKRDDQAEPSTLPLNELTFPKQPNIELSASITSYTYNI